jgi:hypothetical protein
MVLKLADLMQKAQTHLQLQLLMRLKQSHQLNSALRVNISIIE